MTHALYELCLLLGDLEVVNDGVTPVAHPVFLLVLPRQSSLVLRTSVADRLRASLAVTHLIGKLIEIRLAEDAERCLIL